MKYRDNDNSPMFKNICIRREGKNSQVEEILKELPKGDCNWPGYDHVRTKLAEACEFLSHGNTGHIAPTWLGHDHVHLMAVLGCGDEETMKFELGKAKCYGWCK